MPKRKRSTAKTCTEQPALKSAHFPFLKLPAEIRNSIYQHCLPVDRIQLCAKLYHAMPDVNTSLLCVNKQVYTEAMPILYNLMVESLQLELQIAGVLRALKPTLQSSFKGPRVRELKIGIDSMKSVLNSLEKVAEFKRGQKRLLMPFAQLFGLESVQIVGVSDQLYVIQLKRILKGGGAGLARG